MCFFCSISVYECMFSLPQPRMSPRPAFFFFLFFLESRCFALTLPYLIKRDGSGPWGQFGTRRFASTNVHQHRNTETCMHYINTHAQLPPPQTKAHINTLHIHKHKTWEGDKDVVWVNTVTYLKNKCEGQTNMEVWMPQNIKLQEREGAHTTWKVQIINYSVAWERPRNK